MLAQLPFAFTKKFIMLGIVLKVMQLRQCFLHENRDFLPKRAHSHAVRQSGGWAQRALGA